MINKRKKEWWIGHTNEEVNAELEKGFNYSVDRKVNSAFKFRQMYGDKRLEVYGKTPKECREKIEQKIKDIEAGIEKRKNPTIGDFMQDFIKYLEKENNQKDPTKKKDKNTISNYATTIRINIIETNFGKIRLKILKKQDVEAHFNNLYLEKPAIAKNALRLLNKALENAVDERIIAINPARKVKYTTVIKKTAKKPNGDIIKIIQEILKRTEDTEFGLVYQLGFRTGMRKGEILGLPRSAVSLDKRTITIKQQFAKLEVQKKDADGNKIVYKVPPKIGTLKETKTQGSKREIPVPSVLMDKLKNKIVLTKNYTNRIKELYVIEETKDFKADTDLLFRRYTGEMCYPDTPTKDLKKLVNKIIKELGLEIGLLTLHDTRKLANSLLGNSKEQVQQHIMERLLGHISSNTNAKHYMGISPEALRPAVELLSRIIDGEEELFDNQEVGG